MALKELLSVVETATPGHYRCRVKSTFAGALIEDDFWFDPNDHFGISDEVAAALDQWKADGKPIAPYVPVITPEQVNAERDRRINIGTRITVTGVGDVPMSGREKDQITLLALKGTADDMKAAGVTTATIPYRDADNIDRLMTPDQMIEMVRLGKEWVTAVFKASWDLKDMSPIPADFADDSYWPAGRS